MSTESHKSYTSPAGFWIDKKDRFTVLGDYLGRLPSIELLNPRRGLKILDAGCGAGFVTRMLARSGAETYGCDIETAMLDSAQKAESTEPLNIRYAQADITKILPYGSDQFDGIITTGVLIHLSPDECLSFFREAHRVLQNGGRIVLSVTHYDLHVHGESLSKDSDTWIRHEATSHALGGSREYREYYRDVDDRPFESLVWAHPKRVLLNALTLAGFSIVKDQSMYVTAEALQKTGQKGQVGIPAFLQIIAQKA